MGRRKRGAASGSGAGGGSAGEVGAAAGAAGRRGTVDPSPSTHSTSATAHTPDRRRRSGTSGSSRSSDSDTTAADEGRVLKHIDTVRRSLETALDDLARVRGGKPAELEEDDVLDAAYSQQQLKLLKSAMIDTVDTGLRHVTETMAQGLQQLREDVNALAHSAEFNTSTKQQARRRKHRLFSEKTFESRPSLLTRMLRDKDFQTLYNIAVAALIWLSVYLVVEEVGRDRLLDLSMMTWSFGQTNVVIVCWWLMFLTACSVVWLVQSIHASDLPMKVWIWPYLAIQGAVVGFPMYAAMHFSLAPASGFIVMCESVRMFMKIHGYLREKLLHGRGDNQYRTFIPGFAKRAGVRVKDLALPLTTIADTQTEISRFLYYFFCPSLVYRDSYPRTPNVRWMVVFQHIVNVLGCIAFVFVVYRVFVMPHFEQAQQAADGTVVQTLITSTFMCMTPSMGLFLLTFFGVLHSWFNLWAELLTFADREYYTDWWNARNFGAYYRKWNVVVHEWLYYYVYRDVIRFSKGRIGRGGATTAVFVLSALFHEWIILGAVQFWYPVLLVMFGGPGVIFMQWQKKSDGRFFNIFMWSMLSVGMALNLVLYSREWYARHHGVVIGAEQGAATLSFPTEGLLYYTVPQSLPSSWYRHQPLAFLVETAT